MKGILLLKTVMIKEKHGIEKPVSHHVSQQKSNLQYKVSQNKEEFTSLCGKGLCMCTLILVSNISKGSVSICDSVSVMGKEMNHLEIGCGVNANSSWKEKEKEKIFRHRGTGRSLVCVCVCEGGVFTKVHSVISVSI